MEEEKVVEEEKIRKAEIKIMRKIKETRGRNNGELFKSKPTRITKQKLGEEDQRTLRKDRN